MGKPQKKLKVSINRHLINKNQANNNLLFTHGWKNVELTPKQLAASINKGIAYCAQLNGARKSANFLCSDVLSVDIDGSRTIEEAMQDPFVSGHLTIFYTTHSHTTECHRFRLIFASPRTITDAVEQKAANRALTLRLAGDPAAVDATRISFGSAGSNPQVFDRQLSEELLNELIEQGRSVAVPDTINASRGKATSASTLTIPPNLILRLSDGRQIAFDDIGIKSPVCCPFHHDTKASAFIIQNRHGQKGIHCVVCQASFYGSNRDTSKVDFFDFESSVRLVAEKLAQAKQDQSFVFPPHFNQLLARSRITVSKDRYFKILSLLPGITFVKSPKGSGKTTTVTSVLPKLWETALDFDAKASDGSDAGLQLIRTPTNFSTLLIGHRQALIRDLCRRFGLSCYLDDGEGNKQEIKFRQQRYGVCLDSLLKLKPTMYHYDLVIIDEVEQVLGHFLSETLEKSRERIFSYFEFVLKNAKRIIALDADLNWTAFNTITTLAGATKASDEKSKPVWIFLNEPAIDRGTIQLFRSENQLMTELMNSVETGQRVFVTSNSKAKIDAIDESIKSEFSDKVPRIKVTAENSGTKSIQEFIKNIKTESLIYQVILSSPSMGTGIDITFEQDAQHIDVVYGFFENLVNTHFDIDQQIGRVRNPKEIRVWVSPRKFSFETNVEVVKRDLLVSNLVANTFLGVSESGEERYEENDPLLDMASLIVSCQRASKNDLRENFINLKRSQGWQVLFVAPDEDAARHGKAVMDYGKKIRDKVFGQALMNARPIDQGTYLLIEERFDTNEPVTEDERWSFMRSAFEAFYRQPISPELITIDKRGTYRGCVRNFELVTDLKQLKASELAIKLKAAANNKRKMQTIPDPSFAPLLISDLLNATPIFKKGIANLNAEFSAGDLGNFVGRVRSLRRYIESLLEIPVRSDLASKPVQQLGSVLKLVGLSLKSHRISKVNGKKLYHYRIDRTLYDCMKSIVAIRKTDKDLPWRFVHKLHGFNTALYKRQTIPIYSSGWEIKYEHWVMAPVEGGEAVKLRRTDKAAKGAMLEQSIYEQFRKQPTDLVREAD